MDSGSWSAVNGALRLQTRQEIIANNLANADTTAFKEGNITFDSYLTAPGPEQFPLAGDSFMGLRGPGDIPFPFSNPASNALAVTYPAAPSTTTNMTQGALKSTGNPLDVAIDGDGFFVLNTPAGPRYTRDGAFVVNQAGELASRDGFPVQGESGPLVVGNQPVSIGKDGVISNKEGALGRIKRVGLPAEALTRMGSNQYSAPADKEIPLEGAQGGFVQGFLEGSNANVVRDMTQMIDASRGFENYLKMIRTLDELDGQAIQIGRLS